MKEKILSLFVLPFLLLTASGCKAKKQFTVGVECGYPPYFWVETSENADENSIKTTNGQFCSGFDAYLIKHIEKELNLKFQYQMYEFDGLITGLVTKQLDLVIAGMSPTDERKKEVNFTKNYYDSKQVFLVHKNSNLINANKLSDFSNKKIIAQSGTLQYDLIDQIPNAIKETPLPEIMLTIQSVLNGLSDAMITEFIVAKTIVNSNPNLKIVELSSDNDFEIQEREESTAIAVRKELPDLLEKINAVIENIDAKTKEDWLNNLKVDLE